MDPVENGAGQQNCEKTNTGCMYVLYKKSVMFVKCKKIENTLWNCSS